MPCNPSVYKTIESINIEKKKETYHYLPWIMVAFYILVNRKLNVLLNAADFWTLKNKLLNFDKIPESIDTCMCLRIQINEKKMDEINCKTREPDSFAPFFLLFFVSVFG